MFIQTTRKYNTSLDLTTVDPDNAVIFNVNPYHDMHQLEIVGDDGDNVLTAGVLKFYTKSSEKSEWQILQKDGADYELTIVAEGAVNCIRTVGIPFGSISQIKVIPTTLLVGGVGVTKYGVVYLGGRNG